MSGFRPDARDPFDILGVPPGASLEEVEAAYKRLARQYHPDTNPDKDAEEMMKVINAARDACKDIIAGKSPRWKPPPPPPYTPSPLPPIPPLKGWEVNNIYSQRLRFLRRDVRSACGYDVTQERYINVTGMPGIGKSETVYSELRIIEAQQRDIWEHMSPAQRAWSRRTRHVMTDGGIDLAFRPIWLPLKSRITPFEFYRRLYHVSALFETLVLDDVQFNSMRDQHWQALYMAASDRGQGNSVDWGATENSCPPDTPMQYRADGNIITIMNWQHPLGLEAIFSKGVLSRTIEQHFPFVESPDDQYYDELYEYIVKTWFRSDRNVGAYRFLLSRRHLAYQGTESPEKIVGDVWWYFRDHARDFREVSFRTAEKIMRARVRFWEDNEWIRWLKHSSGIFRSSHLIR